MYLSRIYVHAKSLFFRKTREEQSSRILKQKKDARFVVATSVTLFHGIPGPLRNKSVPAGAPDQMH